MLWFLLCRLDFRRYVSGYYGSVAEGYSVLDSGAVGPGFKSQPRRFRVTVRQTVQTHRACVQQEAKLIAALLI